MSTAYYFRSFFLAATLALVSSFCQAQQEFLPAEEAFQVSYTQPADDELIVSWGIAPGYYLYKEKIKAWQNLEGGKQPLGFEAPAGVLKHDPNFGDVEVYFDQVSVMLSSMEVGTIEVQYQGCAEAGLCYPPKTIKIPWRKPSFSSSGGRASLVSEDQKILDRMVHNDRLTTVLSFFGIGILLALTPCVFPMIPILSSLVVGAGAISRRKAFSLSLIYVLGMSLAYSAAGVVSGLMGANIQASMQNPMVITGFAFVFVLLSLSMFGFYELQLPSSLQTRMTEISNKQKAGHYGGAALMGVLSALIVGPCVAPPLAGALLYIGQTGDGFLGGLSLFSMSLGMGVPLVIAGTFMGSLMPKAGPWMEYVKKAFGVAMLGFAVYLLDRVLPSLVIYWLSALVMMLAALLIAPKEYCVDRKRSRAAHIRLFSSVMLLVFGLGTAVIPTMGPSVVAEKHHVGRVVFKDSKRLEAFINSSEKGVLVDIYADWCTACKSMEKQVYAHEDFQAALEGKKFVVLDITHNSKDNQGWLTSNNIVGPPALLYFGRTLNNPNRLIGEKNLVETMNWLALVGDDMESGTSAH